MVSASSGPLRVLMVMTSMERGGIEAFTMNMYRNVDRAKIQFDFLLHREERGAYEDEIEALGGKIYRVRRQNPFDPRYWFSLNNFFGAQPEYAIVHAQLDCLSALPLLVARRYGARVRIAHSHNSRQDRDLKYPFKLICKRLISREATDLFACAVDAGRWMFGTDDFTIVRNAIDVDDYAFNGAVRARVRADLGIYDDSLIVGHVGRFAPQKNHRFILEVFADLLKRKPDAILFLIGDGDLRSDIEAKAVSLGISGAVKFLGVRSDVSDLMQAMDVFLMPSIYEGLPMVLVEAQASGLPCFISDSIPKDCDFAGGSVFRMGLDDAPSRWAAVIEKFDRGLRNRALGAQAVCDAGFDVKKEARRLEDYYLTRLGTKS